MNLEAKCCLQPSYAFRWLIFKISNRIFSAVPGVGIELRLGIGSDGVTGGEVLAML